MHTVELGIQYPEKSDEHMVETKEIVHLVFDENYPYYRGGFLFKTARKLVHLGAYTIGHLVCKIRHGIRITGRENLKRFSKMNEKGFITVCNHVFRYDYICIMIALRPIMPYYPTWNVKLKDSDRVLVKMSGGIPLADNLAGTREFFKALSRHLSERDAIHVFPEGSMWPFYQSIRPFKDGAFILAEKHRAPVIPMAFEFRNPGRIAKLFGLIEPRATLHIGYPVYADYSLPDKYSRVSELKERVHFCVERLHNGLALTLAEGDAADGK